MKEGQIYQSNLFDVKLILKKLEEPNYGRLLWSFNFFVDGVSVNNSEINKYSGLIAELKDCNFNSKDENYIFLPIESGYILYNVQTKNYEKLPNNTVAPNNEFISNYFTVTKLVINRKREIQFYDIENKTGVNISFPFGKYQILGSEYSNNKFMVNYKDLSDYKEYNKEYCFKKMTFLN